MCAALLAEVIEKMDVWGCLRHLVLLDLHAAVLAGKRFQPSVANDPEQVKKSRSRRSLSSLRRAQLWRAF